MSKENKPTAMQEAVLDLKSIYEAADNNARKKIAKKFPEDFGNLLSEELNKIRNKKESVNESEMKDDKVKEPQMEGNKKETDDEKKESQQEMNEMDMSEMSMEEIEEAYENANDDDIFETIDVNEISKEISMMDEKQHEVEELQNAEQEESMSPEDKLKQVYEMISEMMREQEEAKMHEELQEKFKHSMSEMYGESYEDMLGEEKCNELYEMYKQSSKKQMSESEDHEDEKDKMDEKKHNKKEDSHMNEEEDEENGEPREKEEEMDETASSSQMSSVVRTQGNEDMPDREQKAWNQRPHQRNENVDKKMKSLIAENKKLIKSINEMKGDKSELESSNESYKKVLGKYRDQLQEMAVLNTNIAHVNNLLIQEQNLSIDEKKEIIGKFQEVKSITEADNVYKSLLGEMSSKKENIDEGFVNRINDTIEPSSSKAVTEQVVERTALGSDHMAKIKKYMDYKVRSK